MAHMRKPHPYGQSELDSIDCNHCTFSEIRVWQEFPSQAKQLCDELEDSASILSCDLPNKSPIQCPGAAWEVQWACQEQLASVNMVAERAGMTICGAGGLRSFTPSDLLVWQKPAGLMEPQAELVSGVVIVKAPWHFQLAPGDTLERIFANKCKLDHVKAILQKVALLP